MSQSILDRLSAIGAEVEALKQELSGTTAPVALAAPGPGITPPAPAPEEPWHHPTLARAVRLLVIIGGDWTVADLQGDRQAADAYPPNPDTKIPAAFGDVETSKLYWPFGFNSSGQRVRWQAAQRAKDQKMADTFDTENTAAEAEAFVTGAQYYDPDVTKAAILTGLVDDAGGMQHPKLSFAGQPMQLKDMTAKPVPHGTPGVAGV